MYAAAASCPLRLLLSATSCRRRATRWRRHPDRCGFFLSATSCRRRVRRWARHPARCGVGSSCATPLGKPEDGGGEGVGERSRSLGRILAPATRFLPPPNRRCTYARCNPGGLLPGTSRAGSVRPASRVIWRTHGLPTPFPPTEHARDGLVDPEDRRDSR